MLLAGILRIKTFRNKRGILLAANDIHTMKQELMSKGFIFEDVEVFEHGTPTIEHVDSLLDSLLLMHMDLDRMNTLEAMGLEDMMHEED